MIEIKFQGNSMENIIRQIQAFTEKIEIKEAPKRGKHERREKPSVGSADSDLGEEQ